ncbi:capsular biosynthesis protein [Campylobacter sp. TTU-622]|uniref:capsular biosynthesis protein n=1 Tax=Campylobacter sp. TTU-622 TaxID=2800583 RepID=UPI0019085EA4|nr:capsular biosynthesis protein [Campylobacter sp. TTU-622]MBK1973659.1 capsular biosynthesis protein [Campylobacter sp. TTU-622]
MILITSAKYSSSDFTLEFGKIPPSFLPLGNKRLYEYQIKLFKKFNQKIFLSLPNDFKLNKFDKKKLKEYNVEILFVPNNLSLGESIVYCLNVCCVFNEKFYILHGDTFFKELEFKENSLQVAKVKENYDWTYLDNEFKILSNTIENDLILAGAFSFSQPQFLIKCIVENNYSFIDGIKSYSKVYAFDIVKNDTWLDFGLITNYFHSKKAVSTQRSFNNIKILNGCIKKSSSWQEKIKAEINWFENLPKELFIYTPKIITHQDSYEIEYLYNNTLAELYVFGKLPSYVWKRIFKSLKEFLDKLHSFKSNNKDIDFNYKEKTLKRLQEFSTQSKIDLHKNIIINSKTYPSILTLVEKLDFYMSGINDFSLIHGDFCFSNIMYDFRAGAIKTFDPRGFDFSGKITPYGDKNYDFAKLVHSIFGLYDFIIAGFFECKFENNKIEFFIEKDNNILDIQKEFLNIFSVDDNIKALTLHLFLSMLPLHNDFKEKQIAFLANAFILYDIFFKESK